MNDHKSTNAVTVVKATRVEHKEAASRTDKTYKKECYRENMSLIGNAWGQNRLCIQKLSHFTD
jgi:hypothetical protein